MRKRKLIVLLGSICLTIAMVSCAAPTPAPSAPTPTPTPTMEPMTLLYNASIFAPNTAHGETIMFFCDEVTKRTNGLIKFKQAWSFSLTKPGEEIDAVKSGLSDLCHLPVGYYPTKLLLMNGFDHCVPFGPTDADMAYEIFDKLLYEELPMLGEELEQCGCKWLFAEIAPSWHLESSMPIIKLDDLKGKKIAVTGHYPPLVVEAAGATPLPTTMVDRATCLQTGMLDGSMIPLTCSAPFGIYEFAKHCIPTQFGWWIGCASVINLDLFNSFPEDIQQIFVEVGREANRVLWEKGVIETAQWTETLSAAGTTFYPPFSDEDMARWAELAGEPVADFINRCEERGLPGRKVMETYFRVCEEAGFEFISKWGVE